MAIHLLSFLGGYSLFYLACQEFTQDILQCLPLPTQLPIPTDITIKGFMRIPACRQGKCLIFLPEADPPMAE